MKLSILMPVYNEEKYIEEAIDSVLAQQTDFDYELVIVNDCSTDRTAELIKDYQQRHPRIRHIELPKNRGCSAAFCTALEAAQGEYFLVLDGDDYFLHPLKLQRQVDFLDRHPDHVAVTHNYLRQVGMDFELGVQSVDEQKSWCAEDGYSGLGYFHTATYMYRNIFQGTAPDLWKRGLGWCDNIRLMTCLALTEKKVNALNFVGSVYRYNGEGGWSSLSREKQAERYINNLKLFLQSGISKNKAQLEWVDGYIGAMENHLRKMRHRGVQTKLNVSFDGFRQAAVLMISFVPPFSLFFKPKRRAKYIKKLSALQTLCLK